MKLLTLFTDASVDPESGIGFGAFLLIDRIAADPAALQEAVQIRRFEHTSSTRLELETVIGALREIRPDKITIYSDSQNLINLPNRRARLERANFCSNQNKPLNQADLYREFFQLMDRIDCTFVKVKGHRRTKEKNEIEQIFTLVDRASRQALRAELMR